MKRISKFISVVMVVAILFMLFPVSALGAGSEETAKPGDNETTLVLVTNETAAKDATGAIANTFSAPSGISFNPIYGDVDLTASYLYLEPIVSKDVKQPYYGSSNLKTGVNTMGKDALAAGAMILSLIGLAIAGSKQEDEA